MITAIGTGIGEEFDVDQARYHKVVLTCDADVDGAHIRTLILTFLFRHMKELIEAGYVYIAQPPLYRLKQGNDARYFEKDHQLEEWLIRERLEQIEMLDRDGEPMKLTEARLQRFQRALQGVRGLGRQAEGAVRPGCGHLRQGPSPGRARHQHAGGAGRLSDARRLVRARRIASRWPRPRTTPCG